MSRVLRTIVFIGSARDSSPPWGGDKRLGDRIVNHVLAALRNRNQLLGGEVITHDVTVLDPVKIFGDGGELSGDGEMRLPHFFAKQGSLPGADKLAQTIKAADAIIVISPEYNHSVPPALSSLLGHFGGSNYAGKPSAIITYSPGPWGGMRAAMALRPLLSELGCLSISKLTGYPSVSDLFNEDGTPKDPENRMLKQLPAQLTELEWVATAFAKMRAEVPMP